MADINVAELQKKIEAGEELTAEERQEVMSEPNPDVSNKELAPEDDIKDKDFHEGDGSGDDDAAKKAAEDKATEDKKAAEAKAAEDKKAADEAAKKADDGSLDRITEELDKPTGQEDLSGLTKREVDLFWAMRRERRNRQKAEEERDGFRFKELKRKQEEEAREKKEQEDADPFKDRNPEDILTIKDMRLLLEQNKKTSKGQSAPFIDVNNPITRKYLELSEETAKKEMGEDYDEVMACSDDLISKNEGYLRQVAEAMMQGKNPAIVMYNLIKGDPEFPKALPAAQAKIKAKLQAEGKGKTSEPETQKEKEKAEALEKQKKLKENEGKPKTSAHASGADEGKGGDYEGYTVQQLVDMSDAEFAKVPKKVRDKFLKDSGV